MNGLVRKDLYLVRTGVVYVGVFAVVFCLIFRDDNVMTIVSSMLFASLVGSSFAWDDQCQWNLFAVSSGIPRKRIVQSKYMSAVVFVGIGTAIGFAIDLLIPLADGGHADIVGTASLALVGFVLGMIVTSISIAVNYRTGNSTKAQYVSIVVLMLSIMTLVSVTLVSYDILGGNTAAILGALAVVAAAIVLATYRVSCSVFERRDL